MMKEGSVRVEPEVHRRNRQHNPSYKKISGLDSEGRGMEAPVDVSPEGARLGIPL